MAATYMPDVPPDYIAHPEKMPRPYVRFEVRETEVRDREGKVSYEDVVWVLVMPPGSKDVLEKRADEWIKSLEDGAKAGRLPHTWPGEYANALDKFRKGEELPVVGTPIKTWSALSKAQVRNIIAANILTIEDLAAANDETKDRIGMGGRALAAMAKVWLDERNGPGSLLQKYEALRVQNETMESQLKELQAAVESLKAQVPGATKEK